MAKVFRSVTVNSQNMYFNVELYNGLTSVAVESGLTKMSVQGDAGTFSLSDGNGDTKLPPYPQASPFLPGKNQMLWHNTFNHPSGFDLKLHYGQSNGNWGGELAIFGLSINGSQIFRPLLGSNPAWRGGVKTLAACCGEDYFWVFLEPSSGRRTGSYSAGITTTIALPDCGVYVQKIGVDKYFIAVPLTSTLAYDCACMDNYPMQMVGYILNGGVSQYLGALFGVSSPSVGAVSSGARVVRVPDSIAGARIRLGAIHSSFCTAFGADIEFDLLEEGTPQKYIATTSMGPTSTIAIQSNIYDAFFTLLPVGD